MTGKRQVIGSLRLDTAWKWVVAAALVLTLFLFAVTASPAPAVGSHQPGAAPDRIILTWSGDPATTQSVTWRTAASDGPATAELVPAGDGPAFAKAAKRFQARSERVRTNLGEASYHSVTFTGLRPDTLYAYRVGGGSHWSEWAHFRTASAGPAPLEFIYLGDAQNDIKQHWSRVIRSAYQTAPRARFILHAGDLITTWDRDEQWGEWHEASGWINASVPSIPAPGNHEYGKNAEGKRTLTPNWRAQFTLPEHGLPGLEETSYYVDIHGVRVIALNSVEQVPDQAEWLERVLKANTNRWTVVTFHHPVLSTARDRDNKSLREAWQPVFDRYGVDLVLTGHDHTYVRSGLIKGSQSGNPGAGTVYVVSVSGPKMYELNLRDWMLRKAEQTQFYQVIRIDGDQLEFEARTATQQLYDRFKLTKRAGGPNQLTNEIPNTPELRGGGPSE